MRTVVLLPVYMSGPLLGCSTYYHYKNLAQALLKRGHRVVFYTHEPDSVDFEDPNLILEELPNFRDQYIAACYTPESLPLRYNFIDGSMPADILITSAVHALPTTKIRLSSYVETIPHMPIGVYEVFPKFKNIHSVNREYEALQIEGYKHSDRVFLAGAGNYEGIKEQARPLLLASEWSNFCNLFDHEGFSIPPFEEPDTSMCPHSVTVFGRLSAKVNPNIMFYLDHLRRGGSILDIRYCHSGGINAPSGVDGKKWLQMMDGIRKVTGVHRKRFLSMLKESIFAVTPADRHDFPTALLECVAVGTPCIVTEGDWVENVLPNYPFTVPKTDRAGFVALAKFLHQNPKEAREMLRPHTERVRSLYFGTSFTDRFIDWIEQRTEELYGIGIQKFRGCASCIDLLKTWQGGTFEYALTHIRRESATNLDIDKPGTSWSFRTPVLSVRRALVELGFRCKFDQGREIWYQGQKCNSQRRID